MKNAMHNNKAASNGSTLGSVDILARLVGMRTVSCESNRDLIDFAASVFRRSGFDVTVIWDDENRKGNLLASIGPRTEGGIIFSGHTDVVPANEQSWKSNPFELIAHDDRYYGRGTADMKGFCAVVLALAPLMAASKLKRPLHVVFTYDEEIGCLGWQHIRDVLVNTISHPRAVIVGEPTYMQIAIAHKGIRCYRTHVTGLSAHSSRPDQGVNAIQVAANFITHLTKANAKVVKAESNAEGFNPPHQTLNIATVNGGSAINIIPNNCELTWEIRPLPGSDPQVFENILKAYVKDDLLPAMQEIAPNANVVTEAYVSVPAFRSEPQNSAREMAIEALGHARTTTLSFTTEAGLFSEIEFPTVVCGPGSMDQAHKANEFVEAKQLAECEAFLGHLIALQTK